jgi:hypothetical protein
LLLLAPIVPASTANGLAMRCELFRAAAGPERDVLAVVVPVAGDLPTGVPNPAGVVLVTSDAGRARQGVRELAADAAWADRLARCGELPRPARIASPGLAQLVAEAVAPEAIDGVHVMRSYLAPLGLAVAERVGARWASLDLDDDDAALAAQLNGLAEAAAYDRLVGVFGPLFGAVSAASAAEAASIAARHGFPVQPIPNAVELPAPPPRPAGALQLLFVGNLTYAPNVEAAEFLATSILPEVRRQLGEGVSLELVGPSDSRIGALAGPGVRVRGFVRDLAPVYAAAGAVVCPIRAAAGTRFKLLEAFAHGVPVVASPAAAAGLDVEGGRHLLIANGPADVAAGVVRVLTDPRLAGRLGSEARELVAGRYTRESVTPAILGLYARAAAGQPITLRSASSASPASTSSRGGDGSR